VPPWTECNCVVYCNVCSFLLEGVRGGGQFFSPQGFTL
jgi:hypothetical protein